MLLVTTQTKSRRALIEQLAKLQSQDADEIAGELYEARLRFWNDWQSHRPAIPATWYVLLGPRLRDGFDMASLATGGHDLVMLNELEALDPL